MSETAVAVYQPKQRNAMMIKNLCPGLMEMGKIKIGNKGAMRQSQSGTAWQAPQKLDHFLITTNERGQDNNFILDASLHAIFGEAPKEIPVRLIYDSIELNFATRYICYYGKTVFCSGDGEQAQRLNADKKTYSERTCPCERQDPTFAGDVVNGQVKAGQGKCKINGILSVIIDGAMSVGGVWKFRTTSYNSVVGILSSLALIQRITGGRLAGIPMIMTVTPKTVADPISQKQQTIYVVGLKYAGTMDSLRNTGYEIAMTEAKHGISMKRIEEDAMLMLSHTPTSGIGDDSAEDVIAEFYPEEAMPGVPALVGAAVEYPPLTAERATADQSNPIAAPPLAPVTIEVAGETVDTSTGEVTETVAEKEKRTRRTKAEMEAARLAEASAVVESEVVAEQVPVEEETAPHPAEEEEFDNDKDFPPPPAPKATPAPCGDLF